MKKCIHCAEEIQDEAKVCKHCGRDVAPVAASAVTVKQKTSGAAWLVLGIIVVLVVLTIATNTGGSTPSKKAEPILNISAGRSLLSLQLTNREASPLSDCTASITDPDHTTWVAVVNKNIAPLETVHLYWSSFYASGGQSMPNYLKDRGVSVRCMVTGLKEERSAGIGR